jgi:hypothetical protein
MEDTVMSLDSWSRVGRIAVLIGVLWFAPMARAADVQEYGFAEAAQEITQLFWLAETAAACGWASAEDSAKFKYFSVRYLAAHLSGNYRVALVSMVTEDGYEDGVRRAAQQTAHDNCDSARWHTGWTAYKAAADQHEQEF